MSRRLELRCPHCGARGVLSRDRRIPVEVRVLCGKCSGDITSEVKRAFLREVAVGISGNLVERENRAFFEQLEERWRHAEGDREEDSPG
jgi:ribosomal protein S27AE